MTTEALLYVGIALLVAAAACFRLSRWSSSESDFWMDVHYRVLANPALDDRYRPLLMWARENRPGVLARLRGWKSPEARRG